MGLKSKIKTELGYMVKGAKILPKYAGKKALQWGKEVYKNAQEKAAAEAAIRAEAEKEAKATFNAEYKKELIKQAKVKAAEKAKKAAQGQAGWRGVLNTLGQIGANMEAIDITGAKGNQRSQAQRGSNTSVPSAGSYLLEGLPQTGTPLQNTPSRTHYQMGTNAVFEGLNPNPQLTPRFAQQHQGKQGKRQKKHKSSAKRVVGKHRHNR